MTRDEVIAALNLAVRQAQNRADAYDEFVAQAVGLNRTDQRAMDVLDQEGGATPGRLAERMGLTSGAIATRRPAAASTSRSPTSRAKSSGPTTSRWPSCRSGSTRATATNSSS